MHQQQQQQQKELEISLANKLSCLRSFYLRLALN